MSRKNKRNYVAHRVVISAMCAVFVSIAGCSGSKSDKMFAEATDSNAKRLGTLYAQYQVSNRDRRFLGPADKEAFVAFIKEQNARGLERIGVDPNNLEAIFVSERDNQPFKIRWAVQGVSRGPAQPVIFESEGRDGKFIVGFTGFIQKEVDQAEYDRLWSGAADGGESESE